MKRILKLEVGIGLALLALFVGWRLWNSNMTDRGQAWKAVHRLGDAVMVYRSEHGSWPSKLDDLSTPDLLRHNGVAFDYDPAKPSITLPVMFPPSALDQWLGRGGEGRYGMDLETVWRSRNSGS